MRILDGLLKQACVYWPPGTLDKFGNLSSGNPIPLRCQWVNKKTVISNPNGKIFTITSQVFLSIEVQEEGWLWLGDYKNRPQTPPAETQIQAVTRQPDIDNNEILWIAMV